MVSKWLRVPDADAPGRVDEGCDVQAGVKSCFSHHGKNSGRGTPRAGRTRTAVPSSSSGVVARAGLAPRPCPATPTLSSGEATASLKYSAAPESRRSDLRSGVSGRPLRSGGVALRRRGRGALVTLGRPTPVLRGPPRRGHTTLLPCGTSHHHHLSVGLPERNASSTSPRRFKAAAPLAAPSGQGFFRRIPLRVFPSCFVFPPSSLLSAAPRPFSLPGKARRNRLLF